MNELEIVLFLQTYTFHRFYEGEQSLKEMQMKLREEETKCEKLETELAKKNSILISDRGKFY